MPPLPQAAPSPSTALDGCGRIVRAEAFQGALPRGQPLFYGSSVPQDRPGPPNLGSPRVHRLPRERLPAPGRVARGHRGQTQPCSGEAEELGGGGWLWWHPHTCTAPNSPSLSIKGSIFFPCSPPALRARPCSAVAASQGPFQVLLFRAAPPPTGSPPAHPCLANPLQQPLQPLSGLKKYQEAQ